MRLVCGGRYLLMKTCVESTTGEKTSLVSFSLTVVIFLPVNSHNFPELCRIDVDVDRVHVATHILTNSAEI